MSAELPQFRDLTQKLPSGKAPIDPERRQKKKMIVVVSDFVCLSHIWGKVPNPPPG